MVTLMHPLPNGWVLWLWFASLVTGVFAEEKPPREIALIGGKIATQTSAGSVDGSVLIRDGKIAGIGQMEVPSDALRMDISGMVVTPGWIDARSCLWLTAVSARVGATDGGLGARDGVDLFSEDWKEVVRQGVTAVYVQPGATGLCGGRGVVLRVAPGKTEDDLLIKVDAGAQASWDVPPGPQRLAIGSPNMSS
jgi:imidazolonepropionase-like amidohydrolase